VIAVHDRDAGVAGTLGDRGPAARPLRPDLRNRERSMIERLSRCV
jgi:hypothetical protein